MTPNPFAALAQPLRSRPGDPIEGAKPKPMRDKPVRKRLPAIFPHKSNPWRLSGADCEMLTRLARGEELDQIAEALNILPKTVTNRIGKAMGKAHARNRIHLVVMWDRYERGAK